MIHEALDVEYWKHMFSLTRLREEAREQPTLRQPDPGEMITKPYNIALVEQCREASFACIHDIERVPTDIFIWNRGEPNQRAITKMGGLPYRQAGKPWPIAPSGFSMTFMAQFCFVDSLDILPSLPGDILLLFFEYKKLERLNRSDPDRYGFIWGHGEQQDSTVTFEWVSLGDGLLVTQEEIPLTPGQIMPCYGSIYRTWDYPTVDGTLYPEVAIIVPEILEATKIGGAYPYTWVDQDKLGHYLCTLCSMSGDPNMIYPFINEPTVWNDEWYLNGEGMTIGDIGLMNFFLTPEGTIRWVVIDG